MVLKWAQNIENSSYKKLFVALSINLIAQVLISCSFNEKEKDEPNKFKIDKWRVTVEDNQLKDWKCITRNGDRICNPDSWKAIDQDDIFYFSRLNFEDKNSFFCILKYDTSDWSVNIDDYLNGAFDRLKKDTVNRLTDYQFTRLNFTETNMKAYYGEVVTKSNALYLTYTMYVTEGNTLYDFTLRVPKSKENYYKVFQDILYNYQTPDGPIFNAEKPLDSFEILDMN